MQYSIYSIPTTYVLCVLFPFTFLVLASDSIHSSRGGSIQKPNRQKKTIKKRQLATHTKKQFLLSCTIRIGYFILIAYRAEDERKVVVVLHAVFPATYFSYWSTTPGQKKNNQFIFKTLLFGHRCITGGCLYRLACFKLSSQQLKIIKERY